MPQYEPPLCMNCIHFDFADKTKNSCAAFPAGIPTVILTNDRDHRKPVNGDRGIRFEPVDALRRIPTKLQAK